MKRKINLTMLSEGKEYPQELDLNDIASFVPREGYTDVYLKQGGTLQVKESYSQIRALQTKNQILHG